MRVGVEFVMIQPRLLLFFLLAVATLFAGDIQASSSDRRVQIRNARVGGKWKVAWNVRLGTVRGILVFKQRAAQLSGIFQEYGHRYLLSGSIQGQSITFEIPFPGPRPYTIEFKGIIDSNGDGMRGTSQLKGGGHGFLGHAGEVDEPQRPWTATKGPKRPNNSPDNPPDDDDIR